MDFDYDQPCMGAALLHRDLVPVVFNNPDKDLQDMHRIGFLFNPNEVKDNIMAMYVVDADTIHTEHEKCQDGCLGSDWVNCYDITQIGHATMTDQCKYTDWDSQLGEFIESRQAFQDRQNDIQGEYLETEIDVFMNEDMWNYARDNALQAVVVETASCQDSLPGDARCNTGEDEDEIVENAKFTACRVALSLYLDRVDAQVPNPLVPVFYADHFRSSAGYAAETWDVGSGWFNDPNNYIHEFDCCSLTWDLWTDDMHAAFNC